MKKAKVKSPATKAQWSQYLDLAAMIRRSYDPKIHKREPTELNLFEEKFIMPYLDPKDREKFRDVRSVYKYYRLKVQGEALGRILGRKRSLCSVEMARNMEDMRLKAPSQGERELRFADADLINSSDSKSVVFSRSVAAVDAFTEILIKKGFNPRRVHGGTNKDLASILKEFAQIDDVNPIVATYPSLSTAVPLIEASTIICLDQPFRDNEKIQAVARCDRLGQKFTVRVFDIYLDTGNEPNISTRSKDILEWSQQQVETIMARTKSVSLESETVSDGIFAFDGVESLDQYPAANDTEQDEWDEFTGLVKEAHMLDELEAAFETEHQITHVPPKSFLMW